MKNNVFAILISVFIGLILLFCLLKKEFGSVSLEQKIKVWSSSDNKVDITTETNKVLWSKRTMILELEDGKVKEVKIGLDQNGNFIWKKPEDKTFNYKVGRND